MFGFGFASGLPWPLTGLTLRQWLSEAHAPLAVIGATGSLGLAYSLKFLWAPLLDRMPAGPASRLGRRRGWLLMTQLALAGFMVALSVASPKYLAPLLGCAGIIGFLSATQDISIDAWRIETFSTEMQAVALAAYIWGYRIALLAGGSGVIALATPLGWHGALLAAAAMSLVGLGATLAAREPTATPIARLAGLGERITAAYLAPLREFLTRPRVGLILFYVITFKLGEATASVMLQPFYRTLGFDRAAVAIASGPASLAALILGYGVGSLTIRQLGLGRALITSGLGQAVVIIGYLCLTLTHPHLPRLVGVAVLESFTEGLADSAFLTYLSGLCAPKFTATQYALLSSLATIPLRTLGAAAGVAAAALGWRWFFIGCAACGLPAMLAMVYLIRHDPDLSGGVRGSRG